MSKDKQIQIGKELEKLIGIAKGTIKPQMVKVSAGLGEEATNSGTNLTRPEIIRDILKSDFMKDSLYARCNIMDVSDKANGLFMVVNSELTRTTLTGILGGFIAYDLDEGDAMTPSRPKVDQSTLYLNRKGVIVRVTNALIQDSLVLEQYLSKGLSETIRYYSNQSILYGNGTNGCNGILDASGNRSTKFLSLSNAITVPDLKTVMKYYYGGPNGCWIVGRDMFFEIQNLYANTLPLKFHENGECTLFGYPVIRADYVTARCLVLGDFSQFLIGQKPIREEVSDQLYFSSNETAFRTTYRLNGMTTWVGGVTEESGQITYPFVAIDVQDLASSSSSSSESSPSSLSSASSDSSSSSSSLLG